MAELKDEIRDFETWDFDMHDSIIEGVTLKHAYDMILQHKEIKFEKDCPTPSHPSYYVNFVEKGHNKVDKVTPEEGIPLPSHWNEWHRDVTFDEFKSIPHK